MPKMLKTFIVKSSGIIAIMSLVRWPNLLLLALIQVLAYSLGCMESLFYLAAIVLMTACLAAAGYTVNDILDQDADQHNNRKNVFSTHAMSPKTAWRLYAALVAIGFCFSVLLSAGWSIHFVWIYLAAAALLWAYSEYLKGLPLIGNLVVSFICGGAVCIVYYPVQEFSMIQKEILWLSAFAFIMTWIRELVKDLEDIPGDMKVGYNTLPIALGIPVAKGLAFALLMVVLGGLFYLDIMPAFEERVAYVCWVMVLILLLISFYLIVRTHRHENYHRVSSLLKLAMLLGTLTFVL